MAEEAKEANRRVPDSSSNQKTNEHKRESSPSTVSANKKKKTAVSWTDGRAESEERRTKFNESSTFNDSNNNLKKKHEQKVESRQIKPAADDRKQVNSIRFDSSSEPINGYQKNERRVIQNSNYRKNSKTTRFNDENRINWPDYDGQELNQVATRFVHQIIEDATREAEKRLKPSTSRTSGKFICLFFCLFF